MPDAPAPPTGEIVLYQTEDGCTRVECRFVDETLWLSQALIAELFQKNVRTINEHLQIIQNRLHFAATGKTAPELIAGRTDHSKPNMGLTSWKGGVVRKADVTVAKNYLTQEEIGELNRIVTMWLGFAEDQARRRKSGVLEGLGGQAQRVPSVQ
jgi:hypothetical protein